MTNIKKVVTSIAAIVMCHVTVGVQAQVTTSQEFLVPGSDNWKVKLGLSGTTAWWTPYGSGSLPWADSLNQITWKLNFSNYWISMVQASAAVSGTGSGASASGTGAFTLKYYGNRTEPFRSFFSVTSAADAGAYGSKSVDNGLGHTVLSEEPHISMRGKRVYEKTGTSTEISVTPVSLANSGRHDDAPLVSVGLSIRGHSHPLVSIGLGSVSYKKGPGNSRVMVTYDGFGNIVRETGATWDYIAKKWVFESWKSSSQDLYDVFKWVHSAQGGITTHPYNDGNLTADLGSNTTGPTLSKVGSITSVLKDLADNLNPSVTVKNTMNFHKPLENPEKKGTVHPYLSQCSDIQPEGIPAGPSDIIKVKFNAPGASIFADSAVQQVVDIVLDVAKEIPKLKVIAEQANIAWEELRPQHTEKTRTMQSVFNEVWPSSSGAGGNKMGIGIQSDDATRHKLVGIEMVYQNFRSQDWECDIYGASGYITRGVVSTFKGQPEDFLIQGRFTYIPLSDGGGGLPGHNGNEGGIGLGGGTP
jgi:hypothetical protein